MNFWKGVTFSGRGCDIQSKIFLFGFSVRARALAISVALLTKGVAVAAVSVGIMNCAPITFWIQIILERWSVSLLDVNTSLSPDHA